MGDFAERAQLEEEEERRWRRAGAEMRGVLAPAEWLEADLRERMERLADLHQRLRASFDLERRTELVFGAGAGSDGVGMGYDEETGKYIVVAIAELERDKSGPLIAGVAHELRHAFQHEVCDGLAEDPRADEWRDALSMYETEGPGYDHNALEIDAERARVEVGLGYEG